ncbi:Astacin-like metalloendopeptidase [Strongyloides ratti]|uniref:Metalloendopeptidase n=1 Tax=Strongyloides ratti TaxID=34506 RepID=A0A090LV94_STRRB|nr:Astacin-like metalloendopeptidase [Strongyloides ratti]CEF71584.1 Astacin-like metalloendopeptidase [Strongyloides ratti]
MLNCCLFFEIKQNDNAPKNLKYGDILLTEEQMERINLVKNVTNKIRSHFRKEATIVSWVDGIIPYTLSPKFGLMEKIIIEKAMKKIEEVSCFKFKPRNFEIDFLKISPLDGCYSYVGKIGGGQDLSLSKGCIYDYIIIHELLHAIGFEHEHQRYDRDKYINVVYQNIEPSQYHNFDKINIHEVTTFQYKYDLKSIMHYDETAFGKINHITKKKLVTMIPKDNSLTLLDNLKLSQWDIEKLNLAGNCKSKSNGKGEYIVTDSGEKKTNLVVIDCLDLSPFCYLYLKQGLCLNAIYIQLTTSLCPKTCFNCMLSV